MSQTHKFLIDKYYKKDTENKNKLSKSDYDTLRENFKFLLDEDELDEGNQGLNNDSSNRWEMRMVRAYHDRLFKEYSLTDFRLTPPPSASSSTTRQIALRWRTEKEVISGKGQFICGNIPCNAVLHLTSWQVNFQYLEKGIKKEALVKLRLCPDCSDLIPKSSAPKKLLSADNDDNNYD